MSESYNLIHTISYIFYVVLQFLPLTSFLDISNDKSSEACHYVPCVANGGRARFLPRLEKGHLCHAILKSSNIHSFYNIKG